MPLPALIKVLSLGYLLSSACLAVAALSWRSLRGRVNPLYRADCGFAVFYGTFCLCLLLTAYIWYGVVHGQIRMTTHYFHHLMYGGWGLGITLTGSGVLLISLLLALRAWQRTRLPRDVHPVIDHAGALPIAAAKSISTIAVVGVWRPQLWVNPQYWESLSTERRSIALHHEQVHLRRRDNLRKTLLGFVSSLYYVLPPLRRIVKDYELDCELAVDAHCNRETDAPAYRSLIAESAAFMLDQRQLSRSAQSQLSDSDLRLRLQQMERGYALPSHRLWLASNITALGICVVSMLPGLAMLSHPVPRCLLACYLGY